jgi:hypothetical protein
MNRSTRGGEALAKKFGLSHREEDDSIWGRKKGSTPRNNPEPLISLDRDCFGHLRDGFKIDA